MLRDDNARLNNSDLIASLAHTTTIAVHTSTIFGPTMVGSASVIEPSLNRCQIEVVVAPVSQKHRKASGPRKSTGKPSTSGTKTRTKASATSQVKDNAPPKRKSMHNSEGFTTKGPTQKATTRSTGVPPPVTSREALCRTAIPNHRRPSRRPPGPPNNRGKKESNSWRGYTEDDNGATP